MGSHGSSLPHSIGLGLFLAAAMQASPADGQEDCTRLIGRAADAYKIGRFDEVLQQTEPCLDDRTSFDERQRALALRANVFLAMDAVERAEGAAAALLGINPEFTPAVNDDTARFRSLVERMKRELSIDAVSSVSKMNESLLEAPATVVVVTAEQIRRRGYLDLEAVLHDLPGFDISRSNGQSYSNVYQRGYRSDATSRTLFLVDGIEQNDLFSNIAYISRQYPLSNVDQIEVVYGPASTMYGANAFLGVINVITRDPDRILQENQPIAGEVFAGGGAWNTRYVDATLAGRFRGATFSVTGRRFRSDEWDLSGYDTWNYRYDRARYEEKFAFNSNTPSYTIPKAVEKFMDLDNAALGQLNGLPVGYSDLTDDWMISGKLKIRDFLIGVQVWQAKEGAASASTKLAQPGALNGNVWSPQQASMYARYSTALQGNLNLTYLGQAKVHQLQPDSSAFLFRSYIGGPLGFVNLTAAADGGPSPAFWAQTRLAQSSNQFRNEVDLVYRPRRSFSLVGGVDLRYASIQKDYSKSSNCNEEEDVIEVGSRLDQLLTRSPFHPSLDDISRRAAVRGAPFVAFSEGDRTNCIPTSGELKAPAPGEHTAMREIGVFGQASYRPASNVKLVAGWRIDNGDVNLSKGYGTVATPRLAAVFSPRGIVLKAIYAEAFKDPANLERFSIIPGIRGVAADEDLRPERVRNLELSAGRQSSTYAANVSMYRARYSDVVGVSERNLYDELNTQEMGKFSDRMTERWYYTPDTWLESFQNALRQVPAGARSDVAKKFLNNPLSTLKFDNVATLDVWGVQSDGSWRKDRIELFGNYTFTHPVVVGAATGRSRVADIAKQRGMVGIAGGRGKVDASLRFHLVGPRPTASAPPVGAGPIGYIQSQPQRRLWVQPVTTSELTSVGSRRGETIPGHVVGYLSGSYALSTAFTVQVTVDNLFDTSYSDPGIQTADDLLFAAQVPQPGRSAFVRVIARF